MIVSQVNILSYILPTRENDCTPSPYPQVYTTQEGEILSCIFHPGGKMMAYEDNTPRCRPSMRYN